jgi:hypothetical protein
MEISQPKEGKQRQEEGGECPIAGTFTAPKGDLPTKASVL